MGRGQSRRRGWRAGGVAVAAMLSAVVMLGVGMIAAPAALADPGQGSLSIALPAPSGDVAQGPVGANVSISGTGNPGDPYTLGYAIKSVSCQSGFTTLQNTNPITAGSDGSLSATFTWPNNANAVGTEYVICAQDANANGQPPLQSSNSYLVDAGSAPAITYQVASVNTPTPGTLPPPAPKKGHLYAGQGAQISGTNFAPAGTQVQLYLTLNSQVIKPNGQNATQLNTVDGSQITSDSGGSFTATITLPNETGTFYLLAVSADQSDKYPPSLAATQKVVLQVAPVVTPTPSPSPSPTVTPSPSPAAGGAPGGGSSGPGKNTPAVIALAGLSIILFVVGVLLLASTIAGPRPRGPYQQYGE